MKNYFVTLTIASALTVSVIIIIQESQAQNTSPQPVADAVAAENNNPPAPGSGAASQESSAIFVTEIPAGYRDWRLISVAGKKASSTIYGPFWATTWRSRRTGKERVRFRRAQSSFG